jgi:hypothetical protein
MITAAAPHAYDSKHTPITRIAKEMAIRSRDLSEYLVNSALPGGDPLNEDKVFQLYVEFNRLSKQLKEHMNVY